MTSLALSTQATPPPRPPRPPRSIDEIGDEIATLSATIAAATYQLLRLIEELDRRGDWGGPTAIGSRSCAEWLSWRVGFGLVAARQYVRVARALPALPLISAAFACGELSYSKVRAITRIANPANEEMLLDWARAGTASHVEKLVRRYRRGNREAERDRAAAQEESRGLTTYWDNDGMLVVRGRLTPEQGALLEKALAVSTAALHAEASAHAPADDSAESGATDKTTGNRRTADALARVAAQALTRDEGAAPAAARDRFTVVVHCDAEVLADPGADGRSDIEDGPAIAGDSARRLACDADRCEMGHDANGVPVGSGRRRRTISAPLRRALQARDGTRCAFPGCPCRARDAHHVVHWVDGGPTTLANLVSLCRRHHTLVHEGGYQIEPLGDGRVALRRPDGAALPLAPPRPRVAGDAQLELVARWLPDGIVLGPGTGLPSWDGEPADYDWMLGLIADAERRERPS